MPGSIKEIAIVSGKGGTGKTTLAASLALLWENHVVADCDVDAPDVWIVLDHDVKSEQPFVGKEIPWINSEICTGCDICRQKCPYEAIYIDQTDPNFPRYVVNSPKCEGCMLCVYVCPFNAFEKREKIVGNWFIAEIKKHPIEGTPFVYARLFPGEENSGKLVSMVRTVAKNEAVKHKKSTIIIDGPPGIGCPVNSAILGVDLGIIVVEPTPSGIHDAQRVGDVLKHFRIRASVVINKWDLNPQMSGEAEKWAERNGFEVLGKIPYSKEVVKYLNERKVPAEALLEEAASPEIRKVAEVIKDISDKLREKI